MKNNAIEIQFRAANIKRYHIDPIIGEQTVGHHSHRVAQLVRYLTDDECSKALICAALDHDTPEIVTGDMPFGFKNILNINEHFDRVEGEYLNSLGLHQELTDEEKAILKDADILEAGLFGAEQLDLGNRHGAIILYRVLITFQDRPMKGRTAVLVLLLEKAYLHHQGQEKKEDEPRIIRPNAH